MSEAPGGGLSAGPPGGKGAKDGPSVAQFAGMGLQFALSILVFVYAGNWLDRRFGTAPWILLAALFLGAGGSFYSMYRKLIAAQAREEAAQKARREGMPR
jgi:F0F1-type ATP synthase assembly protein I